MGKEAKYVEAEEIAPVNKARDMAIQKLLAGLAGCRYHIIDDTNNGRVYGAPIAQPTRQKKNYWFKLAGMIDVFDAVEPNGCATFNLPKGVNVNLGQLQKAVVGHALHRWGRGNFTTSIRDDKLGVDLYRHPQL
jgi:hypothetical protein